MTAKPHNVTKSGFTLVEVSASALILMMAMALGIAGYLYTLKNISQADVQNELDIDVQLAMESLKRDLRLSSLDAIFYYPAGAGPYQAISFPMARDSDGDGIVEKNSEGKVIWDETVIYHIRPTTPNSLVKTVFTSRDETLSDAQRQAQLEDVVADGDGSSTYNSANTSSRVIFENLLKWKIMPKEGMFDAYAAVNTRDKASMGYILLDAGSHNFQFKVIGKNSSSSGYAIGIDQLLVSPSYGPREAEAQLPASATTGPSPISQYMPTGSWKGNHQLYFPATSIGNKFTLTLPNDRWEETNFGGLGYQAENTRVEFDETLFPKDYVVCLDGMTTAWESTAQTGDPEGLNPTGSLKKKAVRILQKGSELADNGSWISYNGQQCKLTFSASSTEAFELEKVYIGQSTSSTNASMNYQNSAAAPITQVSFGGWDKIVIPPGHTVSSDWIDLPINRDNNYLISFIISDDENRDAPKQWTDLRATDPALLTTMVVNDADDDITNDLTWDGRGDITPYYTNLIFGLEAVEVSYPKTGTYTSQIFDTHLAVPQYGTISWNADLPANTALSFKVRAGSTPDLSDASSWDSLTGFSTSRSITAPNERYIQFQAFLQSDADGQASPVLKDITLEWTGERQLVNIGGIFSKGPGYGTFEVSVDGQPLRSGLIIDLEIYKDVLAFNAQSRRVTSTLKAELTPRNSGL